MIGSDRGEYVRHTVLPRVSYASHPSKCPERRPLGASRIAKSSATVASFLRGRTSPERLISACRLVSLIHWQSVLTRARALQLILDEADKHDRSGWEPLFQLGSAP